MNKRLIISSVMFALCSSAAYADSFNLSIGEPAPVVVEQPAIVVGGVQHVYMPHKHFYRDDHDYWRHHDRRDDHDHR